MQKKTRINNFSVTKAEKLVEETLQKNWGKGFKRQVPRHFII